MAVHQVAACAPESIFDGRRIGGFGGKARLGESWRDVSHQICWGSDCGGTSLRVLEHI